MRSNRSRQQWNQEGSSYGTNSSETSTQNESFRGRMQRQASADCYNSNDNLSESSKQSSSTRKSIDDFEFPNPGQLGQGSYGTVRLALDKKTRERFAIKMMTKAQIFKFCTVTNLKREIRIQKRMRHQNICKLYHYFEDRQSVYLVLEYAPKGNLFSVLRKAQKMDENMAFHYFFQTCLAIDYLHRNGVIHRDLKMICIDVIVVVFQPENLLVDSNNNIKVCDFGWSADNSYSGQSRTTFCGTVDYMAPEMVKHAPHDYKVDIWSLGVLLYELVHGYPPFQGQTQNQKMENISRNQPITFRPNLEYDLVDLIKSILQPNPLYRLSMESIFHHPWMYRNYTRQGIDISRALMAQDSARQTADTGMSLSKESTRSRSADQNRNSNKQQDYYQNEAAKKATKMQYVALNRLDEVDEDLANSNISVTYQNIKRINQKRKAQEDDESFLDKILIAFGCISREKKGPK